MSQQYPLPKHAPLLIALTERRDADSETDLGENLSTEQREREAKLLSYNLKKLENVSESSKS